MFIIVTGVVLGVIAALGLLITPAESMPFYCRKDDSAQLKINELQARLEALEQQEQQTWHAQTERPLYQVHKKPNLPG